MVDNFRMKTKRPFIFLSLLLCLSLSLSACQFILPSPQPTPTPTSALLPPPTPTEALPVIIEDTPEAEVRFPKADLALSFGDYREALKLYSNPPPANTEDYKAAALFGQALSYFKSEDLQNARKSLDTLMENFPQTKSAIRANFLLGQISAEEEELEDAIHFYTTYINKQPDILVAETWNRIGDAQTALKNYDAALNAYITAWQAPSLTNNVSIGMKVARTYTLTGQSEQALQTYNQLYEQASDINTKAAINLYRGNIEIQRGNTIEGYAFFQENVNTYTATYDAYSALVALIDAEQPVSELQRGIINYNVGQNNLAIEAFDRYLESDGLQKDVALYYKALATRAYGLTKMSQKSEERLTANRTGGTSYDKEAIALWTEVINDYPQSEHHLASIEAIIHTQNAYMGQIRLAAESAIGYASMPYGEPYAPGLLYTAVTYYLLDNQIEKAADTWTNIGIAYPASAQAFNALFFGGALYYQLEQYDKALDSFNRALLIAEYPLEIAGSHLWIGKSNLALGYPENARANWQNAVDADPMGYYGIRAQELIDGRAPFQEKEAIQLSINLDNERILAADWLKHAFSLPSEINLDYSSQLANDPRFIRGMEYNRLGLYQEANLEFESLRQDHATDPANTFRLMKLFLDYYYYKSAIECARGLRQIAGYSDTPIASTLPAYIAYVEYGAYYLPWIEAKAIKYKLSPLMLLSLIYQESRFGTQAISTAGARGLMQVMPTTAEQIASETGFLTDFSPSDLDVPYYNLELGSNHLARQFYIFDGDPYLALACYNAGYFRISEWQKLNKNQDRDLFLSLIRILETRVYLRRLVEIHHYYRLIYSN